MQGECVRLEIDTEVMEKLRAEGSLGSTLGRYTCKETRKTGVRGGENRPQMWLQRRHQPPQEQQIDAEMLGGGVGEYQMDT